MLKRKIQHKILEYIKSEEKNALLVTGARQVGKTYIIREVLKNSGLNFIEVNFIENKKAKQIFDNLNSADEWAMRLSVVTQGKVDDNTVIFLDEIQEVKEIVTLIKFLVDKTNYKFILSGSLLGIELTNISSQPVGYLKILKMYPMDFEEFLIANNIDEKVINIIKEQINNIKKIDDIINDTFLKLFRIYCIVGGMPRAVDEYISTNNINKVHEILENIMLLYKYDVVKYVDKNQLYIKSILENIPAELNNKNKRFNFSLLDKNFKYDREKNNFLWLKDAGIAYPCYITSELKSPLELSKATNLFKLYLSDVGLLTSTFDKEIQAKIINDELEINFGGIYENAIAQNLVAHNYSLFYYNNKKRGEVDFVLEKAGEVRVAEIKSGKNFQRHSAISNIVADKLNNITTGFVYANTNTEIKNNIVYLPVYGITFLEK